MAFGSEPSVRPPTVSVSDAASDMAASLALLPPANAGERRTIILAVSGGPDSLALLSAAATTAQRFPGIRFHVVTVDHGLRPEAAGEARFVADVARRFGLPHTTRRWEGGGRSGNRQAQAREARYALLAETARDLGAAAVMTAHHQDDQIETHLLARARHAGDRGLAGMRPTRALAPGIALLRPFLGVPGAVLKSAAAGLDPVDDPSNRDTRYDRVRLRMALSSGAVDRVRVLGDLAGSVRRRDEADARIAAMLAALCATESLVVDAAGTVQVDAAPFSGLEPANAVGLLARLLPAVGGAEHPPLRAAIERLQARLQAGLACGKPVGLTLGGVAVTSGARITFAREYGRVGPASVPIAAGVARATFDRRFDLAWEPLENDAQLVPLGRLGRGNAVERCLPVMVDGEGAILAAPVALWAKLGVRCPLALTERVGWRLCADLPASPPRCPEHRAHEPPAR